MHLLGPQKLLPRPFSLTRPLSPRTCRHAPPARTSSTGSCSKCRSRCKKGKRLRDASVENPTLPVHVCLQHRSPRPPRHHPGRFPRSPPYLDCKNQLCLLKSKAYTEIPGVPALAARLPLQDAERGPARPRQLRRQQPLPRRRPHQLVLDPRREPRQGGRLAPQNQPARPGPQQPPQLPVRRPKRQLRRAGRCGSLWAAPGRWFPQALGLGQGLLVPPGGSVLRGGRAGSPLLVPQMGRWDVAEDAAGPWRGVTPTVPGWPPLLRQGLRSLQVLFRQWGRQWVPLGLSGGSPGSFPSSGLAGDEVGSQLSWGQTHRHGRAETALSGVGGRKRAMEPDGGTNTSLFAPPRISSPKATRSTSRRGGREAAGWGITHPRCCR